MIKCCKNCEHRTERCHIDCVKYLSEKAALDKQNDVIRKFKKADYGFTSAAVRRNRNYKKWINKDE